MTTLTLEATAPVATRAHGASARQPRRPQHGASTKLKRVVTHIFYRKCSKQQPRLRIDTSQTPPQHNSQYESTLTGPRRVREPQTDYPARPRPRHASSRAAAAAPRVRRMIEPNLKLGNLGKEPACSRERSRSRLGAHSQFAPELWGGPWPGRNCPKKVTYATPHALVHRAPRLQNLASFEAGSQNQPPCCASATSACALTPFTVEANPA